MCGLFFVAFRKCNKNQSKGRRAQIRLTSEEKEIIPIIKKKEERKKKKKESNKWCKVIASHRTIMERKYIPCGGHNVHWRDEHCVEDRVPISIADEHKVQRVRCTACTHGEECINKITNKINRRTYKFFFFSSSLFLCLSLFQPYISRHSMDMMVFE